MGGWVFSRVGGSKAVDPPSSYNSDEILGWAPTTPSFFVHCFSSYLLVPLSALPLCRYHTKISLWLWGTGCSGWSAINGAEGCSGSLLLLWVVFGVPPSHQSRVHCNTKISPMSSGATSTRYCDGKPHIIHRHANKIRHGASNLG